MKIFVSHKFRGTDKESLKKNLSAICSVLEKKGNDTFNYFRDKSDWAPKELPAGQVIGKAFEEIRNCDALLAFINEQEESIGMLLEIGFAKALGKKLILLISEECLFPTLEAIADKVIKFDRVENIADILKKEFKLVE